MIVLSCELHSRESLERLTKEPQRPTGKATELTTRWVAVGYYLTVIEPL
jgi:hypothetical protein